jgi:putative membrane protein
MYNENYFWGMNLVWWFVWMFLLVWIFAIPYDIPGQRKKRETAIDILKKRFANGQIDLEEFHDMKKIIEKNQKSA